MGGHSPPAQLHSDLRTDVWNGIFLLAGMLSCDSLSWALLPPALYLGVHLVKGETLTPMRLARRFTLNPVLVILSLVFWFWMWGVPGAILAVLMLAILKIVCDRMRPLKVLGHFLEGSETSAR